MTWQEALDAIVVSTGHERFRVLCAAENPDTPQRDGYRALVLQQVTGELPTPSAPSGPTPTDIALQAYVAAHDCGGCH
jgi:hypothetical protein